ncbi:TIGR02391 family protein [Streptomyces angustmyceticus]|uniref:TIGR02391 family protein n=1 Tax=Streptomyces angustmyceticus TaxID=285578 RepID=UPI00381257EF
MSGPLDWFEHFVRSTSVELAPYGSASRDPADSLNQEEPHPFEARNIHPDLPKKVRDLFDDDYGEQSAFEAFKFIEKEVKRISKLQNKTGYALMMDAFNETNAKIRLNRLTTESEFDEQRGYKSIFAGAVAGIRNPRGHEIDIGDTPDEALDYLALASLLLRRLDAAGAR